MITAGCQACTSSNVIIPTLITMVIHRQTTRPFCEDAHGAAKESRTPCHRRRNVCHKPPAWTESQPCAELVPARQMHGECPLIWQNSWAKMTRATSRQIRSGEGAFLLGVGSNPNDTWATRTEALGKFNHLSPHSSEVTTAEMAECCTVSTDKVQNRNGLCGEAELQGCFSDTKCG